MSLRCRLQRLEKKLREAAKPDAHDCWVSDDLRVPMVRAILARIGEADPFPDLQGTQYMEKFRDWWPGLCPIAVHHQPDWVLSTLSRVSGLTAADFASQIRRYLQQTGRSDPLPTLKGQAYLDQLLVERKRVNGPSDNAFCSSPAIV